MRQSVIFRFLIALLLTTLIPLAATPVPNKIKVALFLDKGARPRTTLGIALASAPDMTFTTLDGEELREGDLRGFDVLVVPGGSAQRESMSMKAEGRSEVRRFVNEGGIYMGICAGCYLLTQARSTDLGLLPVDTVDKPHWARGHGMLPIELTSLGKEVFGTNQTFLSIYYHNGPVINASVAIRESNFQPLGYFRGEFVHRNGIHGLMVNSPAMFFGRFGKGLVLGISPHPEASPSQVQMELNAIRWLYAHRSWVP